MQKNKDTPAIQELKQQVAAQKATPAAQKPQTPPAAKPAEKPKPSEPRNIQGGNANLSRGEGKKKSSDNFGAAELQPKEPFPKDKPGNPKK